MAAGARKNYKFGQKNNWRRTVWNEVLRRTNGREKDEPILYLAGPQDLDRAIALEKGVPSQNMIAIDLSAENVAAVREKKVPAVAADIHDVLRSWPKNRPVCAVILDYCSGLTPANIDVYDMFEREPLRNAVVLVNFQRGRDSFTNAIRQALTECETEESFARGEHSWPMPPCHMVGGAETFVLSEKHRALQFVALHAIETWQAITKSCVVGFSKERWRRALRAVGADYDVDGAIAAGYSEEEQHEFLTMSWFIWANRIFKALRPTFFSYKSGALTFDSAVFQHLARGINVAPSQVREMFEADVVGRFTSDQQTARQISAVLAVRTSRLAS